MSKVILFVLKESQIAKTCSDLLEHDGWRMLVTDPVSDRSRGKGFGEIGMADRLYIRYANSANPNKKPWGTNRSMYDPLAEVMWIEWKRIDKRGRITRATAKQNLWHRDERARGALTLIAGEDFPATIEGFCAWYNASGLQRNQQR